MKIELHAKLLHTFARFNGFNPFWTRAWRLPFSSVATLTCWRNWKWSMLHSKQPKIELVNIKSMASYWQSSKFSTAIEGLMIMNIQKNISLRLTDLLMPTSCQKGNQCLRFDLLKKRCRPTLNFWSLSE